MFPISVHHQPFKFSKGIIPPENQVIWFNTEYDLLNRKRASYMFKVYLYNTWDPSKKSFFLSFCHCVLYIIPGCNPGLMCDQITTRPKK